MDIRITPSKLAGEVNIPLSKSVCHRYLICNFLDKLHSLGSLKKIKPEDVRGQLSDDYIRSEDVNATLEGLISLAEGRKEIHCHESGSTARFLLPLACALGKKVVFTCEGSLKDRPFDPIIDELNEHGAKIEILEDADKLFQVKGKISYGEYSLPADISSQFASGLAMALTVFNKKSTIELVPPLVSMPYLYLTLKYLEKYGFDVRTMPTYVLNTMDNFIKAKEFTLIVSGYRSSNWKTNQQQIQVESQDKDLNFIEGDWSSGAIWCVANFMGANIIIKGVSDDSLQGDKAINNILEQLKRPLMMTIDCSHTPDLVPCLAVAAVKRERPTVLDKVKRLQLKESQRLTAITDALDKIAIRTSVESSGEEKKFVVRGSRDFASSVPDSEELVFNSFGDHRIVMANAILANSLPCKSIIKDAECVAKSYPNFWNDFESLGGILEKI